MYLVLTTGQNGDRYTCIYMYCIVKSLCNNHGHV